MGAVAFVSTFTQRVGPPKNDRVQPVTNAWLPPSTATLVAASAAGPPTVPNVVRAPRASDFMRIRRLAVAAQTTAQEGRARFPRMCVRSHALRQSMVTLAGSVDPFEPKNVA